MTFAWYMTVHIFAVIGLVATVLTILFIACVLKLRRCSEVGAIDLEEIE